MSIIRLNRLEKATNKILKSKNPYDILTDDELDTLIQHSEMKLKGEQPPELSKELQEKVKIIDSHPSTVASRERFKRLSEEEQQKEIERLERKLDLYNNIDS